MNTTDNSEREFRRAAWGAAAGIVLALAAWVAPARAESVGLVTDVVGKVMVAGGAAGGITILTEIEPDTRLQLDSGAQLVVIYFKSGDEYSFSGPAQVQFRPHGPQVAGGAQPRKRASLLARSSRDATIKPLGVTQGAMVMRSAGAARIKLLNLVATRTLETAPEFRWQGEPGLKYQFELNDETGKSLLEVEVEGVALKLPPGIPLREGAGYSWSVAYRLPDGRRYMTAGEFSIAPADLRARAEALRPAAGAPVAERVAFAVWLAQSELRDEARKYWRALAAERPADGRVRALAAE